MIITRTPMRVSFVGGGSDLPDYYRTRGGAVISTAIDKYVYVFLNYRFDGAIRVAYSKSETVWDIDDVEHEIIREALRMTGVRDSVEISYFGDIPIGKEGTGLGSSSALAVGILNALYAYQGKDVSPERLAREACQIEIDILKRPIGKQDQYAAAYGGLNHIKFKRNGRVSITSLPISEKVRKALERNLMLFHTKLPTQSSEVLTEQKKKTNQNRTVLDEMVGMTHTLKKHLSKGKANMLGTLLHENWERKKRLASKITNEKIDKYYAKAIKAGALGGKILGSGGGGFLLLYCEPKKQARVRKALKGLTEVSFKFEPEGSKRIHRS